MPHRAVPESVTLFERISVPGAVHRRSLLLALVLSCVLLGDIT